MAERSPYTYIWQRFKMGAGNGQRIIKINQSIYIQFHEIGWSVNFSDVNSRNFNVKRNIAENEYELIQGKKNIKNCM